MPPPSSTASKTPEVTKSGITTSATGDRVIPASVRADGSQRREIRVRPGYRPPEDVEVYKNRTAEAFRNRGKGAGVPGAEGLQDNDPGESKAGQSKNARRREARKRAKAAGAGDEDDAEKQEDESVNGNGNAPEQKAKDVTAVVATEGGSDEKTKTDEEKQIKKLKKKLREARELQAKKAKGEGLLQEQFEKVIRIRELMRQLEALGVKDEEGEPVPADGHEATNEA